MYSHSIRHQLKECFQNSGSEKGVFWKRGLFRKILCLEILENLEVLESFKEKPRDCGKERRFRPFSRDSREFRDFRDSRDFSSEKTPFVMTSFSGPEKWCARGFCGSRGFQCERRTTTPAPEQPPFSTPTVPLHTKWLPNRTLLFSNCCR